MRLVAILKSVMAFCVSLALLVLSSASGQTAIGSGPSVVITSVSGYAGHAFVLAEVTTATSVSPAPTGMTHQSPYFAEWAREPIGSPTCPWIWAVYVFNRASGVQINQPPPSGGSAGFGTTTVICASPGGTPVDQAPISDATARLDLDLDVTVSPAVALLGSASTISAQLSSALTNDLNLYLNMAIEDWSVTSWFVDFGDGQTTTINGKSASMLALAHIYQVAGQFEARVVADIAGHAQAAVYDRYGWPHLIQEAFAVDVGNHASAITQAHSAKRYLAPEALVTVSPSLGAGMPEPGVGFRRIDALRGALTSMAVHLLISREGVMTVNGHVTGVGRSTLIGWRLDGGVSDAPAGSGTLAGQVHTPADALKLQWNTPDRIGSGGVQEYVVPMTLYVQTRYSDGHVATYLIPSSFSVSVNFAAESG